MHTYKQGLWHGNCYGCYHWILRFAVMPQLTLAGDAGSNATPLENIEAQLERLFSSPPPNLFDKLEATIVKRAFDYCNNNQVQTARLLGISRNILRTLLKRVGLLDNEVTEGGMDVTEQ